MTDIEYAEMFERANFAAIQSTGNDFDARVQIAKDIHRAGIRAALEAVRSVGGTWDGLEFAEMVERDLLGDQNDSANAKREGT